MLVNSVHLALCLPFLTLCLSLVLHSFVDAARCCSDVAVCASHSAPAPFVFVTVMQKLVCLQSYLQPSAETLLN